MKKLISTSQLKPNLTRETNISFVSELGMFKLEKITIRHGSEIVDFQSIFFSLSDVDSIIDFIVEVEANLSDKKLNEMKSGNKAGV